MRFATRSIRVAQEPEKPYNAVITPIYQTSNFAWDSLDDIPPIDYTRCTNPNRITLEQVIASLEGARFGTCFASGMAAVMAALSFLKTGDHLLMASDIYGGTYRLAYTVLRDYGIEVSEFDASLPETIANHVRPKTKGLIFESPTNPTLRVSDLGKIASIAKARGIITVFDNTFASPALQNPLEFGIDLVLHSTTKYICGHSDVIGGCVVTNDDTHATRVYEWAKNTGGVPSPFDNWLTLRGLKTLDVRMQRHCANAQRVAEYLQTHDAVEQVHFPGLTSHPDHEVAKKQMRGFGGMVSVEIRGGAEAAKRVAEGLKIFLLAESLGGVESLVGYPPLMSHGGMTEDERLARGIPPTLLRLSIGIEDPEDLIEDLAQALAKVGVTTAAV